MKNWALSLSDLCSYVEWRSLAKIRRENWRQNRHSNSAYELHMVLDGSCELEIGDRREQMRAGQGVVIPPGVFHACMSHSQPFLRLTLTFIPKAAHVKLPAQPALFSFLSEEIALCRSVFSEFDDRERLYREERLTALVFLLMVDVLRSVNAPKAAEPHSVHAVDF